MGTLAWVRGPCWAGDHRGCDLVLVALRGVAVMACACPFCNAENESLGAPAPEESEGEDQDI